MAQANTIALRDESRKRIEELFLEAEGLVAVVKKQQQETRDLLENMRTTGEEAYGNLAALNLMFYAIGLHQQAYREIKNN